MLPYVHIVSVGSRLTKYSSRTLLSLERMCHVEAQVMRGLGLVVLFRGRLAPDGW